MSLVTSNLEMKQNGDRKFSATRCLMVYRCHSPPPFCTLTHNHPFPSFYMDYPLKAHITMNSLLVSLLFTMKSKGCGVHLAETVYPFCKAFERIQLYISALRFLILNTA